MGILHHLLPLRDPSRQPAEGKHDREHVGRDAHRPVDDAAVEVDVRIELTLDEERVLQGHLLQSLGDLEQRIIHAQLRQHLVRRLLEDLGARVEVLVHPMAEAHEPERRALILGQTDVLLEVAAILPDHLQHLDDLLISPAVQRTPEGEDARRNHGEEIRLAASHHANRRRAAVLLVIGVQDEQEVERPVQHW